ncbi:MAG: DUF1549 domain-containing protein [Opitutales bacterium]
MDSSLGKSALAGPADDSEFLRRAYLDFAGRIPSAETVRKFLADQSCGKRTKLIDELFADSLWSEAMADRFHVMLMERLGKDEDWRKWLVESFRSNKPWDKMVLEMLSPDFLSEETRGAGFFLTKRLEKYGQNPTDFAGLTRDVGRMFMGVDLQCAECHKHLTIKDYRQVDFQGMYATYGNVRLQNPSGAIKVKWLREEVVREELEFGSAFNDKKRRIGPRLPFGKPVEIPVFKKGEEYEIKPDKAKGIVGKLKFRPLAEIAERMVDLNNTFFARNLANRAWFLMTGRGLIEPLDLAHSNNPPSHPELLDLLSAELVKKKFDLRWFFRELTRTRTYSLSGLLPGGHDPPQLFTVALERPIAAESILRNVLLATGEWDRVAKLKDEDEHSMNSFEELFQSAFAKAPREPELSVNSTLKGALFLRNNDSLLWLLVRREGNLVDRLCKLQNNEKIAEEAFLSVLSRMPTEEDCDMVKTFLENHSSPEVALGDLVWALLSSAEFCVNH